MRDLYVRTIGSARRASLSEDANTLRLILEAAKRELERGSQDPESDHSDVDGFLAGDVASILHDLARKEQAEYDRIVSER